LLSAQLSLRGFYPDESMRLMASALVLGALMGSVGASSVAAVPSAFRLPGSVSADTTPVAAGGYTGIISGYHQTARIVGSSVRNPSDPEVFVFAVDSASPAAQAGIRAQDILLEIDGEKVTTGGTLDRLTPGRTYSLRLQRGDDELEVALVPGPPRPRAWRRPPTP
jgi:membrane-associated protease RseP (regulator of RpoE activity)